MEIFRGLFDKKKSTSAKEELRRLEADLSAIARTSRVKSSETSEPQPSQATTPIVHDEPRRISIHFNGAFFSPNLAWDEPKLRKALDILQIGGDLNIYTESQKRTAPVEVRGGGILSEVSHPHSKSGVYTYYKPERSLLNGIYLVSQELEQLGRDERKKTPNPSKYVAEVNKSLNWGLIEYSKEQGRHIRQILRERLRPLAVMHASDIGAVVLSGSATALSLGLPLNDWPAFLTIGSGLFTAYAVYAHRQTSQELEEERLSIKRDHYELFSKWTNAHPLIDSGLRWLGQQKFKLESRLNKIVSKA